jgi:hypothetical protein
MSNRQAVRHLAACSLSGAMPAGWTASACEMPGYRNLVARVNPQRLPLEAELEMLKAAGRQRIAAGQAELELGLGQAGGGPLPITSSRMGCLLDALERGGSRVRRIAVAAAWPAGGRAGS